MKKWLKIVGWGVAIWSLSLIWPDLNRLLTNAIMIKLILILGGPMIIYKLTQYLSRESHNDSAGQNRPLSPIAMVMVW
jgi:hypothetical protein